MLVVMSGLPAGALADDVYQIQATVAAVDAKARAFVLREIEPVAGKLPFAGNELRARAHVGDLQVGYAHRRIRAQVRKDEEGWRLEYVWPADKQLIQQMQDVNKRLRLDTITRGRKVYRAVGEYLPGFALFDQNGNVVRNTNLRGKKVILNFFFTRCKVAKMCPAATARLVRLWREAEAEGIDGFQIVSISFDPAYDTPGVLNDYGTQRGIDFEHHRLLTGDEQAVEDLLKQLGILVMAEDETLNHTMATLLIDEKGKIIYRKNGSRWSVREFLDRLKS